MWVAPPGAAGAPPGFCPPIGGFLVAPWNFPRGRYGALLISKHHEKKLYSPSYAVTGLGKRGASFIPSHSFLCFVPVRSGLLKDEFSALLFCHVGRIHGRRWRALLGQKRGSVFVHLYVTRKSLDKVRTRSVVASNRDR